MGSRGDVFPDPDDTGDGVLARDHPDNVTRSLGPTIDHRDVEGPRCGQGGDLVRVSGDSDHLGFGADGDPQTSCRRLVGGDDDDGDGSAHGESESTGRPPRRRISIPSWQFERLPPYDVTGSFALPG